MNQIIYPEKIDNNLISYKKYTQTKIKFYKFLFFFAVILLLLFFCYYLLLYYRLSTKDNLSKDILGIYDIQQLYSTPTPIQLPSVILDNGEITNILGIIQIDKINLRYPILSRTTNDFLNIAPCKFYGAELNEYGNLCIAGHNYNNDEFFSNLNLLEIGDIIQLYELNR